MARAIWSGVLTFGLVSVPVELYSATEAHGPVFHQFEKDTTDRIRYQRVNERTADEVEYSDIVKGAETGGGHYVILDQDELDSVDPSESWPGRTRLPGCGTNAEQRRGDPESLAHAQGEAAPPFGGYVFQAGEGQHLVHPAGADGVGGSQGQQVIAGRTAGVDGPGFEHGADHGQRGRVVGVAAAVDPHVTRGRGVQAEDEAHRRRLPD